jgi:hypothetical protein
MNVISDEWLYSYETVDAMSRLIKGRVNTSMHCFSPLHRESSWRACKCSWTPKFMHFKIMVNHFEEEHMFTQAMKWSLWPSYTFFILV